ncbi:MAG: hypothetical protein GEU87_01360 [Alphaproteobacteria bacterium]|nr:hypothetical protein [Alphaproteobacteria bacterium]
MNDSAPAPWSEFGERHFAAMAEIADAGNCEVARQLWWAFHRFRRDGHPQPRALQGWVDSRRNAAHLAERRGESTRRVKQELRLSRRRQRPGDRCWDLEADSPTSLKAAAAWTVFDYSRPPLDLPLTSSKRRESACSVAAAWLEGCGHKKPSQRVVRRWFDERLPAMQAHQRRVEAILDELDDSQGNVLRFPASNSKRRRRQ